LGALPLQPLLNPYFFTTIQLTLFFDFFTTLLLLITRITMAVKVLIPTPLQKFTNEQATIDCSGTTIAELIESLEQAYPGIKSRICDNEGNPRRFLNLYVNSEDIRFLEGIDTGLSNGDEVSIVPAVAGG
jgi:MoaD family protein